MQRRFLTVLLLVCVGLPGCAPSASQRLIGKWKYDAAKAAEESADKADSPAPVKGAILGVAEALGVTMEVELEFQRDQTFTMSATLWQSASAGPWKWKATDADGDKVTVEISNANDRVLSKSRLTFLDNDHIQFTPPGGMKSAVFKRVKPQ